MRKIDIMTSIDKTLIKNAIVRGIRTYLNDRRKKIPGFIQTNFSISGTIKINRKAIGTDLVKAPLNVMWAVPYTTLQLTSFVCKSIGIKKIPEMVKKVPPGFKTAVQNEINRLIITQLLEIPLNPENMTSNKHSKAKPITDALLAAILDQPEISRLFQDQLISIKAKSQHKGFRKALEKRLTEYSVSRIAVSEMTGNIISLATGAGILGKLTPGGISFGTALATAIAQESAISSFFLGSTLGGFYYGLFPASASLGLVVASTSAVIASIAVVSAFSGMITDPIQARLGIHEKRLNQLIDRLEETLLGKKEVSLKIREQYFVRLFDFIDLLRTAAQTIV